MSASRASAKRPTAACKEAITKLKDASKNQLQGLVLDLRNNPGGLLDQAIAVSDDFMDKGEIVSTRGRKSEEAQRWNAESGDLMDGKPIVILINGGSASASEIVAGALQDQRRSIVLGTKSFGKGSVQSIIPIPNHGAIRLTTARYYTPSGRSIQAKGIEPDIEVQQAKVEALGPERGTHEADLRGALSNPDDKENASEQLPAETQGVEAPAEKPADTTAKPRRPSRKTRKPSSARSGSRSPARPRIISWRARSTCCVACRCCRSKRRNSGRRVRCVHRGRHSPYSGCSAAPVFLWCAC